MMTSRLAYRGYFLLALLVAACESGNPEVARPPADGGADGAQDAAEPADASMPSDAAADADAG